MHLQSFRDLIHHIYSTQDEEMDCDGFAEVLPPYVDAEIAGEDAGRQFPEAKLHLARCAKCREIYLALRDVAELDSQGEVLPASVVVQRT